MSFLVLVFKIAHVNNSSVHSGSMQIQLSFAILSGLAFSFQLQIMYL